MSLALQGTVGGWAVDMAGEASSLPLPQPQASLTSRHPVPLPTLCPFSVESPVSSRRPCGVCGALSGERIDGQQCSGIQGLGRMGRRMEGEEVEAQWAGRVARPPLPRTEASSGIVRDPGE